MKRSKLLLTLLLTFAIAYSGIAQDQDEDYGKEKRKRYRHGTHHDFQIDLGMNNWLEDGEFPNDNNALYAVRPWGSWYVALNAINDTRIVGPLHIEWGLGVSWYNFKFENEATRIREGDNVVEFYEAPVDVEAKKSKLTATYVNASLVPVIKIGGNRHNHHHRRHWHWDAFDAREGFRIGLGGYAGYKIASYAKTVVDDRNRDKDHDGFYLNNLRYGLRAQLGFGGVDFFVNYDISEVFVENKGPKLNAFSFGVTL